MTGSMRVRGAFVGWLIVASGCGPGSDGSSAGTATDTASSTGGVATSDGSSAGASTGTSTVAPTSGGATGPMTDPSTGPMTDPTTDATGTTAPDATTGEPTCEDIVGSTDCALLVAVSKELTLAECEMCQGAACGAIATCDGQYPCVDDIIVLRGCCFDDQCTEGAPFCGRFLGTNNVCVLNDDE